MQGLLGDEAAALAAALEKPPAQGLRVNTLKLAPRDFERLVHWDLQSVPWCPSGYRLLKGERPGLHPFHAAGLYYLQEPSAMAVAQALSPLRGELVLDLAAAPGGKSTQLAAMLGDSGLLVANDTHGGRARELSRNLERWGSRRTVITSSTPAELAQRWGPRFDAVLLDAPCSGEGMFRKTPEAIRQWSPELVRSCAARQDSLLVEASKLVRPGGRLAYSTCTFAPEENEEVVGRFLEGRPEWQLLPTGLQGVEAARPEWAPGVSCNAELSRARRLWPHQSDGEGHFVALLGRSRESPQESLETASTSAAAATTARRLARKGTAADQGTTELRAAEGLWQDFLEESLRGDPLPDHRLTLERDGLYAVPSGVPDLTGLRVLRPGLWLGTVERGRFLPSHALALALRASQALQTVDFEAQDPQPHAYLRGLELESTGRDGWTLITVAGHPLGWGRRGRDIVKNHYPKGLRRPS